MTNRLCRTNLTRLLEALNLPPHTLSLTLDFNADQLPRMTVERILTTEEIEALADWYETEGISPIQTAQTTYSLVKREPPIPTAAALDEMAAA